MSLVITIIIVMMTIILIVLNITIIIITIILPIIVISIHTHPHHCKYIQARPLLMVSFFILAPKHHCKTTVIPL
jgi:hypothetical protein